MAALRTQVDELRKGLDAETRERLKLAGELKALDSQQAFLVADAKAVKEESARLQKALEESQGEVRELRAAVREAQERAAAAPPPAAGRPPNPLPPAEVTADKLYATAMASFRAEEHGQAVLEFSELVDKFPRDPLAANAQYWIGEAYYRQRDVRQALVEFQKVLDLYPQAPQVPEALLKIGLCRRALKDNAGARQSWETLVKQFPGSNAALQARSLLSQLPAPPGRSR
jgi:tol-pal system protein YbgF